MVNHPKASVMITVAIIGCVGSIGSALIYNWDKVFPNGSLVNVSVEEVSEAHKPRVKSVIQRAINLGADAYWNLDHSLLEELFEDEAIKLLKENILSKKNQGIRIKNKTKEIDFNNIDFQVEPLKATVEFTRTLRTSSYSLEDNNCIESTPEYRQQMTYYLQYFNDGWKVVAIEPRNSPPQERESC